MDENTETPLARINHWCTFTNRRTELHLYDVCRFLCVLLKQEHGGGIRIDVKPLYHLRGLSQSHIYITKTHMVFVGKRGELGTK